MRIDLGLERVKFAFALGFMLCHNVLHQHLDLARHVTYGTPQMPDLIGSALINLHIQVPVLQRVD